MAIINSTSIGAARRKLGNTVYYRSNGKTIARAAAAKVSNPKTAKQMAQRAIFATAVRSRDALKSIVDHSFENKKYGANSLSYFMKRNLAILRNIAAAGNGTNGSFNVPDAISMQANPLLVSQGSLRSLSDTSFGGTENGYRLLITGDATADYVTVGAFLQQHPEISKGDQLTVLFLSVETNKEEARTIAGEVYNPTYLLKMRITIPTTIDDNEIFFNINAEGFGSHIVVEGTKNFTIAYGNGYVSLTDGEGQSALAACVIVSRPEGSKWLRSTEYLQVSPNFDDGMYSFNDVLNTWLAGTVQLAGVDSEQYLNQGEQQSVTPTYAAVSQSFTMRDANTEALSYITAAGLRTIDANGSTRTQVIYTQNAAQAIEEKMSVYKLGEDGKTLTKIETEYASEFVSAKVKFADANKLLGGALVIAQG